MKKVSIALLVLVVSSYSDSFSQQSIALIPEPVQVEQGSGKFTLSNSTLIIVPQKYQGIANYFINKIKPATGYSLKTAPSGNTGIQFVLNTKTDIRIGQEGYTLDVKTDNIQISANSGAGLFYGMQSVLQLLPQEIQSKTKVSNMNWQIPVVSIVDYPRFPWRGVMLDASRNFFSKEYIKEYIDQLCQYKFNRFHWHLTDDHGWRLEIKSLPRLTEVGAWRVPRTGTFGSHEAPRPDEKPTNGGFYTQADIKEIVQYAKDRFIEILPEIDVPGHSMAAIAAYPELCVTKDRSIKVNPGSSFSKWFSHGKFEMYIDNTLNPADEGVYKFLDKVFTETAALFPFEYIHIGGDECYKGYWERDSSVQTFMKKNGIKNSEELQSYFTKRLSNILAEKNKKVIGWDEILEGGLAPGAAVMSWRGTKGGIEASHLKHPVVMSPSPHYYLDMNQGEATIEPPIYNTARLKSVYLFDIMPPEVDSAYVLGGQGNLWTEQVPTTHQVEYMTYPRAFAIAETLWSPKRKKNWNSFIVKVEDHFKRFDFAAINYAPSMYDPIITVKKNSDKQLMVELTTEVPGLDIYYTLDNTIPNQYFPKYKQAFEFPAGADMLRLVTYRNGKPAGRLISLKAEDIAKKVTK